MKNYVLKLTFRSVRTFFGRYMALLLIVAISVGFFAGLRITQDAMIDTAESYLESRELYDFRLISTLGFTEDDVEELGKLAGVKAAEGTKTVDALVRMGEDDQPLKLLAIPDKINLPSLKAGRMPVSPNECLGDDERFSEADIGKTVTLSDANGEDVTDALKGREYTIVGTVDSPIFLGLDRGATNIGSGAINTFLYLPAENFTSEFYTEIDLTLTENAEIYSDEYDELTQKRKSDVTELTKRLANERYNDLIGQIEVPPHLAALGITAEQIAEKLGLEPPKTFVLTRNENAGYVSFENDTAIVSGIANIFPVFFILIAMLVCVTTMTRMVDEERTQIGVLKAMGFSSRRVMAKYLLYAGSATVIGWALGFFICTWALPKLFWFAYNAIYNFAPLNYLFSPTLAGMTLAIALICILGATFISCRKELMSAPAALIRPRAAKSGKRILLERITPLWRRLPFLTKIITRNMFRYKRRLIMMLLGIGCCAGLVVAASGARDSMVDVASFQFDTVQVYDIDASFDEGNAEKVASGLDGLDGVEAYKLASAKRVDVLGKVTVNSVSLMSFDNTDGLSDFWKFERGGKAVGYPERGEILICNKIAEKTGLSVGDEIELRDADMNPFTLKVGGIFDAYIYTFALISEETHTDIFGQWSANTAMISAKGDAEDLAHSITEMGGIASVTQLGMTRQFVDDALSCLDYIILMVIGFSGALAFVVTFNLTNINLAERSREIATVEVLGFYPKETCSYVLRENLILSAVATLLGLPLGIGFHYCVMSMIRIDSVSFANLIRPGSFLLSVVCTMLFSIVVNFFMRWRIRKIKMAESLKAVE